jgi:hypothetical protein
MQHLGFSYWSLCTAWQSKDKGAPGGILFCEVGVGDKSSTEPRLEGRSGNVLECVVLRGIGKGYT